MFFRRNGRIVSASLGVCDDWIRALPREKNQVFDCAVRRWECWYAMMSVALDDAFTLRACGKLICARQQVGVSTDLLQHLSKTLVAFCEVVAKRGRRIDKVPIVEPMRAEFFRSEIGQSAASWNNVLHHVLFVGRFRFLHKLRLLGSTIEEIERQFAATADDVSRAISTHPSDSWKALDCLHYDFNTCLRETEIVLKSFLRALPAEQLEVFAAELETPLARPMRPLSSALSRPASA